MKQKLFILNLFLIATLLLAGCRPKSATPAPLGQPVPGGPAVITGGFSYTNDFVVETYYVEHAVALNDLTGFIKRDKLWELPINGQVLGYMELDEENNQATYRLSLPVVPEGVLNDVDQDGKSESGVQIFVVTYSPNLTGGPYSEGDDRSFGWPAYLASIKTDTENQDEVTGGRLLIWAQDDQQEFPSDFGGDGLLFTRDDPIMSVPAGYSVIDLDASPFAIIRALETEMTLYEPQDVAVKDYSSMSYTQAFETMFQKVRKEYAFDGIKGKAPNWDQLYAELSPRVRNAEQTSNSYEFFLALNDFVLSFKDGHVNLDGGDTVYTYYQEHLYGGLGFAVRELDNGEVVVVYVLAGGPADLAGMQVGATVIRFNGLPVRDAISQAEPLSPQSTDFGLRYEQTMMFTRGAAGKTSTVSFRNYGEAEQTVTLTSIQELDSFYATYLGGESDENVLPVEYTIFPQGVGYVRINSNYDDLNLLVRIFQRALDTFEQNGLPGIIIDMRQNFGGAPMGLAGFLYDEEIPLGQLEYYSEKTGKFEADGPRDRVLPNVQQYSFEKMVLLVDQFCYSACEIEAYGFSQVPGMYVMGQFPTAGVEAETARGDFLLPDGISLTVPTGRFTLPDGSIFLEGEGVQPDEDVPVTRDGVLSGEDTVLSAAIDYLLK